MSTNAEIRYLKQAQIDKAKWDACLENAGNGLIYGYSFYLDHMAKQWDALVLNDYEAVMPLTWNRKYGIHYLYQPFLCACLGIFGKKITKEITEMFLQNIPRKFRFADISLNHGNLFKLNIPGIRERKNFILNLNKPYNILSHSFSDNLKRNIKKAVQNGCVVSRPLFSEVLKLAKLQLKKNTTIANKDFAHFNELYNYLEQKKAAITYGITDSDERLIASCVFFSWKKRAYYILVGNHPNSKTTGASHALINAFIKDHAATNIILDFEGSDIAGLITFYSGFGAVEENYPALKFNYLPAAVKWLKK